MVIFILSLWFLFGFSLILGVFPLDWERRPTLQAFGYGDAGDAGDQGFNLTSVFRAISLINRPLNAGALRERITRELGISHTNMSLEEFFLWKEICIIAIFFSLYFFLKPDQMLFGVLISIALGYMIPEWWLKAQIRKVKAVITRELPDAIDLLGLCVNAGLDFMLALKWVVEKSPPSFMIDELNILLQEINVGKTRRDALKDLAVKYALPDLSSFSRTLIQADKMGTSVSESLNILSEDMRLARFRRAEQTAVKAPMKLLIPLLFFIFPVVGILVAGPIFLQFFEQNPLQGLMGGK